MLMNRPLRFSVLKPLLFLRQLSCLCYFQFWLSLWWILNRGEVKRRLGLPLHALNCCAYSLLGFFKINHFSYGWGFPMCSCMWMLNFIKPVLIRSLRVMYFASRSICCFRLCYCFCFLAFSPFQEIVVWKIWYFVVRKENGAVDW